MLQFLCLRIQQLTPFGCKQEICHLWSVFCLFSLHLLVLLFFFYRFYSAPKAPAAFHLSIGSITLCSPLNPTFSVSLLNSLLSISLLTLYTEWFHQVFPELSTTEHHQGTPEATNPHFNTAHVVGFAAKVVPVLGAALELVLSFYLASWSTAVKTSEVVEAVLCCSGAKKPS